MASSRTLGRQQTPTAAPLDSAASLHASAKSLQQRQTWRLLGKLAILTLLATITLCALVSYRVIEEVFSTQPRSMPLTLVYDLGGALIAPFAPVDSSTPIKETGYLDFPGLVAAEVYLVVGLGLSFGLYFMSRVMRRIALSQLTWGDIFQPFVYGAGWLVAETIVLFSRCDTWLSARLDDAIACAHLQIANAVVRLRVADNKLEVQTKLAIAYVQDVAVPAAIAWSRTQLDRAHAALQSGALWVEAQIDAVVAYIRDVAMPATQAWCRLQAERVVAAMRIVKARLEAAREAVVLYVHGTAMPWTRQQGHRAHETLQASALWTAHRLESVVSVSEASASHAYAWTQPRFGYVGHEAGLAAGWAGAHVSTGWHAVAARFAHEDASADSTDAPQISRRTFLRRVRVLPPER